MMINAIVLVVSLITAIFTCRAVLGLRFKSQSRLFNETAAMAHNDIIRDCDRLLNSVIGLEMILCVINKAIYFFKSYVLL